MVFVYIIIWLDNSTGMLYSIYIVLVLTYIGCMISSGESESLIRVDLIRPECSVIFKTIFTICKHLLRRP